MNEKKMYKTPEPTDKHANIQIWIYHKRKSPICCENILSRTGVFTEWNLLGLSAMPYRQSIRTNFEYIMIP